MDNYVLLGDAVDKALMNVDTPATRQVKNDTKLYGLLLTIFKANLDLASGKPTTMAFAFADKTVSSLEFASDVSQARNMKVGLGATQIIMESAKLIALAGQGPGIVLATTGAMLTKKLSIGLGLAEGSQQANCLAAMSDLASGTLSTVGSGIALSLSTGGIAAPIALVASLAQVSLAAYNTHQACYAE